MDDLIDPDSDLEPLANALLDGFMAAAKEDTSASMVVEFFEQYEKEIRSSAVSAVKASNIRTISA